MNGCFASLWCICVLLHAADVRAQTTQAASLQTLEPLPDPLTLDAVRHYAREHRAEIAASRARADAEAQRPAVVSAPDDPVLIPTLGHLPFSFRGVDASFTIEQRFPLSGLLGNRRKAAEANARKLSVEVSRARLDVELDASLAFFMLNERRQLRRVLESQQALSKQFVAAATARYSSGTGGQAEVIRAETDVARLDGELRAIVSEIGAAEAMLNTALNRPSDSPLPRLSAITLLEGPPGAEQAKETSLRERPELSAGTLEIQRAETEISATRSMYAPMAMVRTGPGYTMSDGFGWMLMIGISVPIWVPRNRAGIAEAEAMAQMARADLQAQRRLVEGEVATARQLILAARARFLALRDNVVPRAESAIAPALAAYAAGTLPLVSVLDAARTLFSAQADLVMAELELGSAWSRFARALGTERAR